MDTQVRTNVLHIFAIGDFVGLHMRVLTRSRSGLDWHSDDQAKAKGIRTKKGSFPCTDSGQTIAKGRDEGVTKLRLDDTPEAPGYGKNLGGAMVASHASDIFGEILC